MTNLRPQKHRPINDIHADDKGSMTILGLFIFLAVAIMGAFAIDVTNIYMSRTHLQTAADQTAHAALYNRQLMEERDAKTVALAIAEATLPENTFGQVIEAEDIEFGTFDTATRVFVAEEGQSGAVRVRTRFTEDSQNALQSHLMKLVGLDQFNIITESVYTTYKPGCLREGFVAEGIVDIQSNNAFGNGFCIHSNTHVSLNSNNTFEAGTVVSMPDLADLDLPRSGFESNEGLLAALRSTGMNIRVLSRVENMILHYEGTPLDSLPNDTEGLPSYITSSTVISTRTKKITSEEIYALDNNQGSGRVHVITCTGGSGLTIDASTTLENVIIISPCEIKFSSGSSIENARIISKSTSSDSINSPSGLRVGRDDNCAEGGGVQLITLGGMRFPADLHIYGSQLIAMGDIDFAANADGVQGASFIAGGQIDGTSNMNMSLCTTGMEDNIEIPYFRLAY
ncbi:Putative Flp pilus-assembly TadE/G-like [Yoonia tamlensis]|uniref:Putative Flp pilus-assembly TadE/G-like n=1 Tax=Yoonia tamlensis TaxID=390270 RepID=A0A1I6FYC6_9RHOB|nr:Tad domain-containing protein [Yoonia tamlensis]SFR34938.1 Putative Flp pilus-assembly TadE/G-like [Yoonia tamlensis]